MVAEITPSYRGQLAQICRTVALGPASAELKDKYALLVRRDERRHPRGRCPARRWRRCAAPSTRVLEAEGYGEYCHPPHIRRRGHGLGFGSIRPGDVSLDNDTVLREGMVFMIHPNQHLPETGYLLCGEPVLLTARGAEPLTRAASPRWPRLADRDAAVHTMQSDLAGGPGRLGCRRGMPKRGVRRAHRRVLAALPIRRRRDRLRRPRAITPSSPI